jgi:hypothetical protein
MKYRLAWGFILQPSNTNTIGHTDYTLDRETGDILIEAYNMDERYRELDFWLEPEPESKTAQPDISRNDC